MEREHELSDEQAAVVDFDHRTGHLLVLARPGSGKTHTLAARARRLLDDGVEPSQVLAMTFSNHAANRLKDRLPAGGIWAGTFHAISADMLEESGAAIGVHWPFRIVDEVRGREYLLRAVAEAGMPLPRDDDWRNGFVRELLRRIEHRKRCGLERVATTRGDRLDPEAVARVDEAYCRLLREDNALDFADLIARAVELLEQDEPTRERLSNRLTHVLVDEVHDISPEQFRLMELVAPPGTSAQVFVVGDPDQAIYGWRGADANAMLGRFRASYRPVVFHLTRNFRSRPPIVRAADALMKDAGRTRQSSPDRDGSTPPLWWAYSSAQEESDGVATSIARAMRSGKFAGYGDFAVLYRGHRMGDVLETELVRAEIPVCRVEGERFLHDRDVQESLRYLELAYGLFDRGFEPALSWPRVMVDEVTMVHLRRLAERHGLPLSELVRDIDAFGEEISPLTRGAIREFLVTIGRELEPHASLPIPDFLEPFLWALKRRRSPIPRSARAAVRDTLDYLEGSLKEERAALDAALLAGRPVALRTLPGCDAAAAAVIVRHALAWYFDVSVEEETEASAASNAFVLTLGETLPCTADGLGLGPLHTRTVSFGVATRAWRLMQLVLMARETADLGSFMLLDVETTTEHPDHAEILEYGVVTFAGGMNAGAPTTGMVRPTSPGVIDPRATDVHGLRWVDVADAPGPREALPGLLAMLEGSVVVGHNIERFDIQVLRRAASAHGLAFDPPHTIDTRRLAERLWPGEASYRLEELARRSDPDAIQRHRAGDDCLLTGQLFAELLHASRREREIDVLSECLPVLAAGIVGSDGVVASDNITLVGVGARSLAAGHGSHVFQEWEARVDLSSAARVRSHLESAPLATSAEDDAWERFAKGWKATVDAFCANERDRGIGRFLHFAALAQPLDVLPRLAADSDGSDPRALGPEQRVALMTVHSAKGLEWPAVFLVGVEDDQFPHYRATTEAEIAEERRLLYVGMTRAQDWLLLHVAGERNGRRKRRSRFLEGLIGEQITVWEPGRGASGGT